MVALRTCSVRQEDTVSTAPHNPGPPGPPPEPPPDLPSRRLDLHKLPADTELFRIHPIRYASELLYFGRRSAGRFNAPAAEYGTLYAALDPYAAFLETFAREPGTGLVSVAVLAQNLLVRLRLTRPVSLVDLTGASLRRLGADTRVTSGDHHVAQRWALALWQHRQTPDGLYWRSRFDDGRYCVALFDRAQDALDPAVLGPWDSAAHATLLGAILDEYGFGLV
jgi:hypothetical protein